jgi:quercetin dioxygenase-like cupin family protein
VARQRECTVDLDEMLRAAGDGVHWTLADASELNANLVHLDAGSRIDAHVNREVDVLLVVLEGDGVLQLDGQPFALARNTVAHVPNGVKRSVAAGASGLAYLTVHRRRGSLQVTSPSS